MTKRGHGQAARPANQPDGATLAHATQRAGSQFVIFFTFTASDWPR
jgi:hypothetical protein